MNSFKIFRVLALTPSHANKILTILTSPFSTATYNAVLLKKIFFDNFIKIFKLKYYKTKKLKKTSFKFRV